MYFWHAVIRNKLLAAGARGAVRRQSGARNRLRNWLSSTLRDVPARGCSRSNCWELGEQRELFEDSLGGEQRITVRLDRVRTSARAGSAGLAGMHAVART